MSGHWRSAARLWLTVGLFSILVAMACLVGICRRNAGLPAIDGPLRLSALASPGVSQDLVDLYVPPEDPLWPRVKAMCTRDAARCRFDINSYSGYTNVIVKGDGFEIDVTGVWILVIARGSLFGWTQGTGQLTQSAALEWESLANEVRARGRPRPKYQGFSDGP
jgi:hypothetical protein